MKTVLITGASKGIGAACAYVFAKQGYNVIVNYNKSYDEAKRLVDSLTSKHYSVALKKADVSKYKDAKDLIEFTINKYKTIDVLINNAGIALSKMLIDTKEEEWNKIIDTNLKSVYNCCSLVVPHMVKLQYGKIINMSSICGASGASCEVAYSASKAGVIGFTKALSKELSMSNITVNCIAPGIIDTDMMRNISNDERLELTKEIPKGRFGYPSEIAETALFLASSKADYITGETININGGFML